jgi:hypothetical protein
MTFHPIPFIYPQIRRNFPQIEFYQPTILIRMSFFLVGALVFALGHKLTIAFKSIHFGCACTLYILHFTVFYVTRDSTPCTF